MFKPTWDDVRTVYDRFMATWVRKVGAKPNSFAGHLFTAAVFARAERVRGEPFDPEAFMESYCLFKKIDFDELITGLRDYLELQGSWQTDPYILLEVLSEP